MNSIYALLFSFIIGLFFLIGFLVVHFVKRRKELTIISIGMAFTVMIGMLFLDLGPEIIEMMNEIELLLIYKVILVFGFIILGIFLLKGIDYFIPHHYHVHHEKENEKEHNNHMFHIGLLTSISLIFHNILEGMSVYIITSENVMSGFLMMIAIGCHNIPFGIEIASSLKNEKNSKFRILIMLLLVLSSLFGALFLYIFGNLIPHLFEFMLLCVSSGMIFYITVFELLGEIKNYYKDKRLYVGILLGVLILFITAFIH